MYESYGFKIGLESFSTDIRLLPESFRIYIVLARKVLIYTFNVSSTQEDNESSYSSLLLSILLNRERLSDRLKPIGWLLFCYGHVFVSIHTNLKYKY